MSVLAVFLLVLTGCGGVTPGDPVDPTSPVWGMLQRGDDRARGYFLSEVEVNAVDANGKTPLHYAAERKDAQLAQFFIALGANPNALDNAGQSALGIAVENKDPAVAAVIAAGGANIHLELPNGQTAVTIALESDSAVFKALLTPTSIGLTDKNGQTVLHLASIAGKSVDVQNILTVLESSNVSVNLKDNSEKTALDHAFGHPNSKVHMSIAEQLILSGASSDNPIFQYFGPAARTANYNIRRNEGLAPVHYAVIGNYSGMISFLLEKNIDINIQSTSGATPLHEAMRNGNLEIIRMLLDSNADPNARDANGNTPLHMGIPSSVHKEVINLLLGKGANPNHRDEHGDTPLHIAIILNRSSEVIDALLDSGSDVHIRNIDGKTPLYIAVQENRVNLIPSLLECGSEIFAADNEGITPFDIALKNNGRTFNLLVSTESVNQRDSGGNTMLHAAVRNRGSAAQIGRILDSRAPVDARNREGDTALHIAVRTNQKETGEFLISRGANIFSLNSAGHSPLFLALSPADRNMRDWIVNANTIIAKDGVGNNMLHYASQWALTGAIPIIIRNGISVEDANATGQTPLFFAIRNDSPDTIRVLVENRANYNVRDTQGNSLLHFAVRWNAKESISYLLSLGIDINSFSLNGNTPLHDAVALGMSEIETLLITRNANLEVRNIDGNTPFMEAVRGALIPSLEKLAANGADVSTRNTRGDTPLHIAVSMDRLDIVTILLRNGTSIHARNTRNRTPFQIALSISPSMVSALLANNRINIPDDLGNSALHVALSERSPVDIIRTIVSGGARINAVDSNGKTPLRLAVDINSFDSAKIIADAGADPFMAASDNKTPAEIAFVKGESCIRALFSGRGINARDSSGNTILHVAARFGTPESIGILVELGANKTIRNIAAESPQEIALRWNRAENADLLR